MYVVTVTEENRRFFESMIPEEFMDPLAYSGRFVLGAIGEDEEGKYAAGVLSFEMLEEVTEEEEYLAGVLKWLYVAEEFRGRGVADHLVREYLQLLEEAGVKQAVCEIPVEYGYFDLAVYLEEWGFEFSVEEKDEVRIPLYRFLELEELKESPSEKVASIEAIPEEPLIECIGRVAAQDYVVYDLGERIGYCDERISCAVWGKQGVESVMLLRPLSIGSIEVVLARDVEQKESNILDMIRFAIPKIQKNYGEDIQICFSCQSRQAAEFIDTKLPDIQPALVHWGIRSQKRRSR